MQYEKGSGLWRRSCAWYGSMGNRYGITNASNPIVSADAALILDAARQRGITTLDTAPGYGDSNACRCSVRDFEVFEGAHA